MLVNSIDSATGANQSAVADDCDDDGMQSLHASLYSFIIWSDACRRVSTNGPLASQQLHLNPNQ